MMRDQGKQTNKQEKATRKKQMIDAGKTKKQTIISIFRKMRDFATLIQKRDTMEKNIGKIQSNNKTKLLEIKIMVA